MTLLIRRGDRSQEVADVQSRLRALGYDIDDVLGDFGSSTTSAVRAFQQQRGIIVDGDVGRETWNELVEASWRLGDRSLYLSRPYMRGDDVTALQARLNALGYDAGREDGIFGPDTDIAVRHFQKEYGVAEDGIYGPATNTALAGLRVDRPGTAAQIREELRLARATGIDGALVVLDPGHGGDDPGGLANEGVWEGDLCWDLARRMAERLVWFGARVRFTRNEAQGPDHHERARRANDIDGDVFVSLHLNSHDEASAEGACTYFFRASRGGERLAESIQQHLVHFGLRDCRSHPRSYALLRETRMPAVLVEPLYITNPDEAKRLEDTAYRSALADAIAAGIRDYFESLRS